MEHEKEESPRQQLCFFSADPAGEGNAEEHILVCVIGHKKEGVDEMEAPPYKLFDPDSISSVAGTTHNFPVAICKKCSKAVLWPEGEQVECPKGGNHAVLIPPHPEAAESRMGEIVSYIQEQLRKAIRKERETHASKTVSEEQEIQLQKSQKAQDDTYRVRNTFLPPSFQKKN